MNLEELTASLLFAPKLPTRSFSLRLNWLRDSSRWPWRRTVSLIIPLWRLTRLKKSF